MGKCVGELKRWQKKKKILENLNLKLFTLISNGWRFEWALKHDMNPHQIERSHEGALSPVLPTFEIGIGIVLTRMISKYQEFYRLYRNIIFL